MRWAFALALSLSSACKDPPVTPTLDSATTTASAPLTASAPQIDAAGVAPLTVPCRLIVITGDVRTSADAGLHSLEAAPLDFIALGAGASMTAKDGKTSREITFNGPGAARVCLGGREEEWLLDGELTSSPGAGETPGAEVWVMTLHGVVRYGGGHVRVTASRTSTAIRAQLGAAVYPVPARPGMDAGAADADGWIHLSTDANLELSGPVDVRSLLAACSKQAGIARDLAEAMVRGDAGPLGDAASQHVVERRKARALCGMAALGAATAAPFSQSDVDLASAADETWRRIPNTRTTP